MLPLQPPPLVPVIVNPLAGRKAGFRTNAATIEDVQQALASQGIQADIRLTEYAGHATQLAREAAASGARLVVAAGGDGTVLETASGIVGTSTALGVLPLGSVMNTARALHISPDLSQAAGLLRRGHTVRIDVGHASTATRSSHFLEAAGIGVDAGLFIYANQLDAGNWRSLVPLMHFISRFFPQPVTVTVDGRSQGVYAFMVTVAIGPFEGVAMPVAPEAQLDDRRFEVVIRAGFGRVDFLRHLVRLLRRSAAPDGRAQTVRGSHVRIEHLQRKLLVHADGHSLGTTPAEMNILPAALLVVVGDPPIGQPPRFVGPRYHLWEDEVAPPPDASPLSSTAIKDGVGGG